MDASQKEQRTNIKVVNIPLIVQMNSIAESKISHVMKNFKMDKIVMAIILHVRLEYVLLLLTNVKNVVVLMIVLIQVRFVKVVLVYIHCYKMAPHVILIPNV